MKTKPVEQIVFGLLMALAVDAYAADTVEKEELPGVEFLEFIGSWETSEGAWVDPKQFMSDETIETADMENAKDQKDD